jgi:hypothetical protein
VTSWDDLQDTKGIAGVAVAPSGAMAYVEGYDGASESSQRIGYAPVRGKQLGAPRVLADDPRGEVDSRTLTVSSSTVSWTTLAGEPGSVAIP